MNTIENQIWTMVETLQRLEGILYVTAILFIALASMVFRSTRWYLIAFALWICTFAYSPWTGYYLAFPLQQLRTFGRGLVALTLALLLIPTIRASRGWRSHFLYPGLIFYFLFQMVVSLRMLLGGDFSRGYFAILCYFLLIMTLGVGLNRWLQTADDAHKVVRAVAWGGILFAAGTLYQYAINKADVVWAGRLLGTSGNANHAALILASALPPAVYLFLRSRRQSQLSAQASGIYPDQAAPRSSVLGRILAAAAVGMFAVMCAWTGSRTGALVAVFALVMLFRFRLGRFLVSFVVCGVFVYIMLMILNQAGIENMATRLIDVTDTRSAAWIDMLGQFRRNPLFGISAEEAEYSENSYLLVAARTGVIGIVPFLIGMIITTISLVRLQRLRQYLGEEKLLADVTTAGLSALAVGGMFEGYLFAVFSFPLFTVFIYLNLLDYCVDRGKANMEAQRMAMYQQSDEQQPPYDLEYEPQEQWPAPAYQQ